LLLNSSVCAHHARLEDNTEQFDSISRQRSAERGQATKDLSTIDGDLQSITSANHEQACKILPRLTSHQDNLKRWDAQILSWVNKTDETRETNKAMECQLDLDDGIATLSARIEKFKASEAAHLALKPNARMGSSDASGPSTGQASIIRHERIQEIELTKFDGNILNWQAFWADFAVRRSRSTTAKTYPLSRSSSSYAAA